jgi:rRNA maturation endonuclease Nob1
MGGMLRCDGCGSIRWDVLNLSSAGKTTCSTCGEPLKPERRRPGRRAGTRRFERTAAAERRDVTAPPAA